MTNFEKIKQLTLEEFAEKFNSNICRQIRSERFTYCYKGNSCKDCILNWLNQEADDDGK